MVARAAVYEALTNDQRLADLGFGKVYPQATADTPAEQQFLVLRWGEGTGRPFGQTEPVLLTVWFHDKARAYDQIDLAVEHVKGLLGGLLHVATEDGWVLTCADWGKDGPDLQDPAYGTVTRWADFKTLSRYAGA